MDGSVQLQDGHVKAVRLGGELKVGVHFNLSHSVGESWQWLNLGVDDVVAKGHLNLARSCPESNILH